MVDTVDMASSMPSSSATKDRSQSEVSEADLAQAWKELQKGEKTAQALEANLTSLEKKLDDLLASFEESERLKVEEANSPTITKPKPEKDSIIGGEKTKEGPDAEGKAGGFRDN